MPVILSEADHDTWLNPQQSDRGVLTGLLRPYDSSSLELYPVSTLVNSPRHDSPQCVDPLTASGDEPSQRTFGFHEETGGPH
jgi:putative SOS response-associated peptidase YedK